MNFNTFLAIAAVLLFVYYCIFGHKNKKKPKIVKGERQKYYEGMERLGVDNQTITEMYNRLGDYDKILEANREIEKAIKKYKL